MKHSTFAIRKNITVSKTLSGVGVFTYRTNTPGVLTVMGSFFGGDTYAPKGKGVLPDMVAGLLDAGTKKHTKDELRTALESLGANVSISARGNRIIFTMQLMPEDIDAVLAVFVEQLRDPIFPAKELSILAHQFSSALHEERSETSAVAMGNFLRAIYPKGHANYQEDIPTRLNEVKSITRSDAAAFHRNHFGRNSLYLAVVGDVDEKKLEQSVRRHFKTLPEKHSPIPTRPSIAESKGRKIIVSIKDKMAADVVLGHEVALTRKDADYYPLLVLIELMGASGFTSHLFQTVRERDGLTYMIRAGLAGFGDGDQGHWFVRSMFAPHLFAKGLATIQKEIAIFLESKITDEAVEKKKEELVGAFAVSLGTTGGLARVILWTQEEGMPLDFIDTYPDILRSITPEQVRKAARHINPSRITISAAGSIDTSSNPL